MARKIGILKEFLPALLPKYKIMLLEAFSPHDLLTAYIKNTLAGYPRLEDQNLDDLTVEDVRQALKTEVVVVDEPGADLVNCLIEAPDHKKIRRRQIYEQTGSSDSGQA